MMLAFLIATMVLLIFLGMEIAWAIGVACLAYLVVSASLGIELPYVLIAVQMLDGVDSFSLLAIPLFMFAGELMGETGMTRRLVRMATAFIGHIRGGLANVGVTTNFALAGISGSAIADAAATGTVLLPEMKKKGYPPTFSAAVIAASSTVGPIIPPSISFVLLGSIVNLSVGQLFLAGVVPGVMMSAAMFALTYVIARRRGFPVEDRASWRERIAALFAAALPLLAPLIIVRSITIGLATPTEAAAILVVYVMFLGVVAFRTIGPLGIVHCAARAALITSIIMLTVGTAQMFSWLSVYERFGEILTAAMLAISTDLNVLLLLLNVLLLLLGTFMEPLPLMLVMAPVIFPLFTSLGYDPITLGVVFVINVVLGLITPPVGLILSVVGVIGRIDPMAIFRDLVPYKIVLLLVLLAITYYPPLTLWLPRLLMPGT
jgi:tripartite ATP-independent transporter DctM subunit